MFLCYNKIINVIILNRLKFKLAISSKFNLKFSTLNSLNAYKRNFTYLCIFNSFKRYKNNLWGILYLIFNNFDLVNNFL